MGWCTDDQRRRVAIDLREVYMSKIVEILAAVATVSATVGAFTFSDLAGSTTVGNDNLGVGAVDSLAVNFEPGAGAPASFARNLSGFDMGGALLVNVHMLWTEGQANPEVIADFLTNQ